MGKVIYKCDAYKVCSYPFRNSVMMFYFYSSGRIVTEHEDGTVIKQFTNSENYKSVVENLSKL